MSDLRIKDLVVEYSSGGYAVRPINGLNLDVAAGSLVILLGPSGCGKTTLLSCIGGILRPKSGSVEFDGTDITKLEGGEARHEVERLENDAYLVAAEVPQLAAVERCDLDVIEFD